MRLFKAFAKTTIIFSGLLHSMQHLFLLVALLSTPLIISSYRVRLLHLNGVVINYFKNLFTFNKYYS